MKREIASVTWSLDAYRAITIVDFKNWDVELVAQSWYDDAGQLGLIINQLVNEMTAWWQRFGKPVIISEYGADTYVGLHQDPSFVWTEDYQLEFMNQYFDAFDNLYFKGYLIGEMIWNFADFATKQDVKRAVINRKGIFTRERRNQRPLPSARLLKQRYTQLPIFAH